MRGIDAVSGKELDGVAHLRQSIRDILTTPIGTRVMRRDYGSRVFELIDKPLTGQVVIELYAAVGEALAKWEPRFKLLKTEATGVSSSGRITIALEGEYLIDGRSIRLEGIEL